MEANLVAGAAILPVGVLALRQVRAPAELPFASLPLLLAAHQLVEALVWGGVEGAVPAGVAHAAAGAYVAFALPLLPTLVPLAVLLVARAGRRRLTAPFLVLGVVVSVHLTRLLLANGVEVEAHPYALVYRVGLEDALVWTGLYVLAVIGACLVSGHRAIVVFGLVNLVGLAVVALVQREALTSLWCFYAAVSSVFVLIAMVRRCRALSEAADDGPVPVAGRGVGTAAPCPSRD